jgi:hypothetical protein
MQAALSARVRSATRSSRLSESRLSTSEAASGSTAAKRSLREAASAVARASSSSFLRALPLESTLTRAESLGGTSTTHSPAAANLTARCLPQARQRSPPLRATLAKPFGLKRWRDLKPARLCGKVAPSTSWPEAWSTTATATPSPCGDRPRSRPSCAHLHFGRASTIDVREGHSEFGTCSHTSFESLRPPRSLRRDASREQANPT